MRRRKYPQSRRCFRSTSTSCGEKCVFCWPVHLSAIKVSADTQFRARVKLIEAPHIRIWTITKDMSPKFEWLGVVALWKIYSQREKNTSPRMLSVWLSTHCVSSICKPTCVTRQNQPESIIKLQEITPLSPYDWCNFPSSTGKGYLGLFKSVLYCLWNCHYLYNYIYFLELESLAFAGSSLKLFKRKPLFLHPPWPQAPPNDELLIKTIYQY